MRVIWLCGLVALTGCSTIIEGRSQELTVNTTPPGATCTLVRNNMTLGTISPTPGSLNIEKTKYDINVTCAKEGYQDATFLNKSDVAGATFGNIALGGLVGWAVDSSTGADNKYDTPIDITLIKK